MKKLHKNTLLLVFLFIILSFPSNAQFSIGPMIGVDYTMIKDGYETFKPGGQIGAVLNYKFDEDMAIDIIPNYSLKGAKDSQDQEIKLNYFENQVAFRYYFENKLNLLGGSYFGILTSAKVTSSDTLDLDVKDELKSADIGLVGGIGYQFGKSFGLTFKYLQGLSKINKDGDLRLRNIGMQFSIYYIFQISDAK
jgi:hypothetical protein